MKKKITTVLLIGLLGFAALPQAGDFVETLTVNTKPIPLKVNGVETKHENSNSDGFYYNGKAWVPSTMIYEGTTYVPIRVVAESLGKNVVWESGSKSISFTDSPTSTSPKTKKIPVFVEGQTDMRESTLTSGTLDYDMYLLKDFALESEEPFKDVLLSTYDSSFFVRIEALAKNTSITDYKKELKDSLEGTVHDLNPTTIFDAFFHDADFYLLQETRDGNVNVSITHLVKEYGTKTFKFTIFMPSKEAAEGIGPSFWAMLKTIETK